MDMDNEKATDSNTIIHEDARRPDNDWKGGIRDAKQATEVEHQLTLLQGLRAYPKAVAWSVLFSGAIVMDGFDQAFIPSLFAEASFQKQFGFPYAGGYQISASWQTAFGNSSNFGTIIGIFLNGYLTERFGKKRTLLCSLIVLTGFIFIPFFAPSLPVLLVGELLIGICLGIFNTTAPAYASEVCPLVLRAYLTSFINLSWVIGQLIAACVMLGVQGIDSSWGYKIPFAVQWVWPVPLFIAMCFAPESPWWLMRRGRLQEAERSLTRLSSSIDAKQRLAMMIHTDELEQNTESGTSYWDCFKGVDRRRTEIVCMTWAIQMFSGLPMQGYNTYFFEQAGLPSSDSFDLSVGYYVIGAVGTILAWFLMAYFGRRRIFLTGLGILTCLLFIIGFASLNSSNGAVWAQSVLLLLWVLVYDMTVGPLAFTIVSEVSSTRLRSKALAFGRNAFQSSGIVFGVAVPYMLNPTEGNWKGKAGFFFGGTCFCSFLWAYFRLPELKDRTYEELDILFEKRVSARKFRKYEIDAYHGVD